MGMNYLTFFKFSALIATSIVFISFILEFYFQLTPCKLCIFQRYGWIIISIISVFSILNHSLKRFSSLISLLALTSLSILSAYHSLVEMGTIDNLISCSVPSGLETNNIQELEQIIINTENNDCAFTKFKLLGFSLSNLGFITSLCLTITNLLLIKKELSN